MQLVITVSTFITLLERLPFAGAAEYTTDLLQATVNSFLVGFNPASRGGNANKASEPGWCWNPQHKAKGTQNVSVWWRTSRW